MTNFSVIITAGGSSSRFGSNKLLETLNNHTVIEETVSKFTQFSDVDEIIIPANKSFKSELIQIFKTPLIQIIEGGETRQKSVYNALKYVKNKYVLIHDGARPLVSKEIIKECMTKLLIKNAITVMTKTTDTIKEVDENGKIIKTIDRTKLYNTQTPQGFELSLIKKAHNKLINKNFTDDASMLEELNEPVFIINGDYANIKITTKTDLDFARLYINQKS